MTRVGKEIKGFSGYIAHLAGLSLGTLALSTAYAGGDFGGSCCADLEERVAELEETAVRKGNRKISVVIRGAVNAGLMYINDGSDEDLFVAENTNVANRLYIEGSAPIRKGWRAGYRVQFAWDADETVALSLRDGANDIDDGTLFGDVQNKISEWYIKSDKYGALYAGTTEHATFVITWMELSGTLTSSNTSAYQMGGSVRFRDNTGTQQLISIAAVHWDYIFQQGDAIRYDSPTIGGFKFSAAWGEDDVTDAALRYGGKWGNFLVLGGLGYADSSDGNANFKQVSGAASALHLPTGLNLTFAAGDRDTDGSTLDQTFWYVKSGLKRKFHSWGTTAISASYIENSEHLQATGKFKRWGLQFSQMLDATDTEFFAHYSNTSYQTSAVEYQDIDIFMAGVQFKFNPQRRRR